MNSDEEGDLLFNHNHAGWKNVRLQKSVQMFGSAVFLPEALLWHTLWTYHLEKVMENRDEEAKSEGKLSDWTVVRFYYVCLIFDYLSLALSLTIRKASRQKKAVERG